MTLTFTNHLKPFYYLARFFGIFHFRLYHQVKISNQVLNHFWSVPYFTYHVTLILLELHNFQDEIRKNKNNKTFRKIAFALLCFLKLTGDYFWFLVKRHKIKQILNQINSFKNLTFKTTKIQISIITGIILITWISSTTITYINGYSLRLLWINAIFISIGLTNFIMYIITATTKKLFESINTNLRDLKLSNEVISIIRKNAETHFHLTELARQSNSIFAIPLLGNSLFSFFLTVFFTYHLLLHLNKRNSVIFLPIHDLICLIFVSFQMVFLVRSWDSVVKEV